MNHLIQEANSFSKINWACAVILNPFVGFGKFAFVDSYRPVYLKKSIDLSIFFVWNCAWWGKAENGVGGGGVMKLKNSLLTTLNWSKCILMVSLNIWLSIYTNNETLRIIWKFDLSSRRVLGRIYALSIEGLQQRQSIYVFFILSHRT